MNLILTLDYELYGDGSGDVFKHIVEPTDRILKICDEKRIKITLFFEALEYIKLKEQWNAGHQMGYQEDPILAIESQLTQMALNGHDIQLHVHPQWINAKYIDNKWQVDLDNWRLGDFSVEQNYTIEDMLREGKETIESIIQETVPDYCCTILRAGGYNVIPSDEVYTAMVNLGLKVDSSVYPGGYETGILSRYDYRKTPVNEDYWQANPGDFSKQADKSEVIEIPIFALPQRRIKKINFERIKSVLKNRGSAAASVKSKTAQKSKLEKIKFLFEKEAFTWDFCLFSFSLHKTFFNFIEYELDDRRSNFVIIGHPKSFTSDKSFKKMIVYAEKKGYQFITLSECYEFTR